MENSVKRQSIQEKREYLKGLSAGLGKLKKDGRIDSVNGALEDIYAQQGHTVLKTYNKWKEAGYQVKRGETALLLWGRPKAVQQEETGKAQTAPAEMEQENRFFPLAFVFSKFAGL
jgi:hypothetical protein